MAGEKLRPKGVTGMKWMIGVLVFFLESAASHGDVIVYKVPSGEVLGAFRDPIPLQPGYAQVTVPNADLVVWPAPAGCTLGQKQWALVTALPSPTFTLNPALTFFRCHPVGSATDVDRIVEETIAQLSGPRAQQGVRQMHRALGALDVLTVECPPGSTTSGCDAKRTSALALRNTELTLQSQMEQVYVEGAAVKVANGW